MITVTLTVRSEGGHWGSGLRRRKSQNTRTTAWQSLHARLVELVREVRVWAARGAFTTKLHLSADGRYRPLSLLVTRGQRRTAPW
ncbi:hypothetical protein EAO72_11370 [Streptomyces sp. or43]|nr:hypothetical protein EAO72_11370 [Streptomyces sp. or43]